MGWYSADLCLMLGRWMRPQSEVNSLEASLGLVGCSSCPGGGSVSLVSCGVGVSRKEWALQTDIYAT